MTFRYLTNGFPRMWSQMLQESRMLVFPFWGNCFKGSTFSVVPFHFFHLNGNIFVDSPSIRSRNPTWKVLRDFIDFEKQIHVEIMTSIQRDFDVVSTFKSTKYPWVLRLDLSMSFWGRIDVTAVSLFPFYHFLTFSALGTYSKIIRYSAESI